MGYCNGLVVWWAPKVFFGQDFKFDYFALLVSLFV